MTKATRSTTKMPAVETMDSEVLEFRSQFDERSPLDEVVQHGAQKMLQAAIDKGERVSEHAGFTIGWIRDIRDPPVEASTGCGKRERSDSSRVKARA